MPVIIVLHGQITFPAQDVIAYPHHTSRLKYIMLLKFPIILSNKIILDQNQCFTSVTTYYMLLIKVTT